MTTAQLASSSLVGRYAMALQQAALESAGPQVRNRATIGGNIATASPAGDLISPLYALGATVAVAGNDGPMQLEMSDVVIGVKKNGLAPDQIITGFIIPKKDEKTSSAFEKTGKRKAMTISSANAACQVTLSADQCTIADIRVVVGAVGPTVGIATQLEEALRGAEIDERLIKEKSLLAKRPPARLPIKGQPNGIAPK